MSTATLSDIITKIRKLTGSGNQLQIKDTVIIDYINSFYLYDFPAEFRSLQLKNTFTINTIQNVDTYPFDFRHYSTLEAPAYVDKKLVPLHQSPWPFYSSCFNWQYRQIIGVGDGTVGAQNGPITGATNADPCVITAVAHGLPTGSSIFITGVTGMTELNGNTFTISNVTANTFEINLNTTLPFGVYVSDGLWNTDPYPGVLRDSPIIRSINNNPMADTQTSPVASFSTGTYPSPFREPNPSRLQNLLITANTLNGTENVTDDGNGNLIGGVTVRGTINYRTGVIQGLRFANPIPAGTDICVSYCPSHPSVPQAVLYWQNNITLRPVPDKGYTVEIVAYRRPSQVLLGTENPDIPVTTGLPELLEWWETIAFGASKKIFEDRLDIDGVAIMDKFLSEAYSKNETRTYAQLGKQQIGTIFSSQEGFGGGFGGWGDSNG